MSQLVGAQSQSCAPLSRVAPTLGGNESLMPPDDWEVPLAYRKAGETLNEGPPQHSGLWRAADPISGEDRRRYLRHSAKHHLPSCPDEGSRAARGPKGTGEKKKPGEL